MSLRIKAVVDKFVQELKEALDADIQDRIMKEREMQSYIEEREREVAEREAAWKAELSRREGSLCFGQKLNVPPWAVGLHLILSNPFFGFLNAWRASQLWSSGGNELSTHENELMTAEIARQEARLKMEKENLEKEKSVLMGTASNQDNQDGALEITVSGEKYRCLRFAKAKK
ncbi:hypothetical protein CK203_002652 [Vitis vinifera]|uniref:Uncharacterized protein n=1 Tax=Vitis vinifera TaxID=29760 RepID=A0A438KI25_VITVI|nr:hypothetical protein CK203_002652 [Vitis vinifera]